MKTNRSVCFGPLLLLLCWACSYHGESRQNVEAAGGLEAFDELPQPVGGYDEIQKNLSYPEFARKDAIAGKVVVEALINEEGRIEEMKVVESLSVECDQEALRAIASVQWKPAMQQGEPVRARIIIPVSFTLRKMHPNNE